MLTAAQHHVRHPRRGGEYLQVGKHASKDFVILSDEDDRQWFAEGDIKEISLLSRIVRYGQTCGRQSRVTWKSSRKRSGRDVQREATKTLSSPGITRSNDKVNDATDLSEDHARTCRTVCNRISQDIFLQPRKWQGGNHVGNGKKMRMVQRFVTQFPVGTITLIVDADCTRRSTTDIAACHRKHMIKASTTPVSRCQAQGQKSTRWCVAQPRRWACRAWTEITDMR